MQIDLISRALYLQSKGEYTLFEEINKWIHGNVNDSALEFIVENEKYYWKEVSSMRFNDVINEDKTTWFILYSENLKFMAITKKQNHFQNLIGEETGIFISTIWILRSNIPSIEVDQTPILIYTPHHFDYSNPNLAYHFKQLIVKLMNPIIKLTQIPSYASPGCRDKIIR